MDFIDPEQHRHHVIMVFVGYFLVGLAILITTVILLYVVYGFGYKKGEVVQNGLIFVSSTPNPADIYLNGKLSKNQTNSRFNLQEGNYKMVLQRTGYRTWQRNIQIVGGQVVHYDYPFLFPKTLTSTAQKTYDAAPEFTSSSPDRRWLLVAPAAATNQFEVFDLKDPKAVTSSTITVPDTAFTVTTAPQSWKLVEWSNDNKHVVLQHLFGEDSEYVLVDRTAPETSVNLSKTLGVNPTELHLIDKKYDKYYLYDAPQQTLTKATLESPTPVKYIDHVLAFKSYSDDMMLYAASAGPDGDGSVKVKLQQGDNTYMIHSFPGGTNYVVDLAKYAGDFYVVAGATSENKVYIYKNPTAQIANQSLKVAVPVRVLRVTAPNYVSFSDNTRFIMAENGTNFAVYDLEDTQDFTYETASDPMDEPQLHASWMDGHRLTYVSKGMTVVFDYDDQNRQALVADKPAYAPMFDTNYKTLYTMVPPVDAPAKVALTATPLLTPADQ